MNRESTRTQVFKSGDKIELDPTVYNPSTIVLRGTELWVARAAFDMGYSHALNKVADLWQRYLEAAAANSAAETANWAQVCRELDDLVIATREEGTK